MLLSCSYTSLSHSMYTRSDSTKERTKFLFRIIIIIIMSFSQLSTSKLTCQTIAELTGASANLCDEGVIRTGKYQGFPQPFAFGG